MSDIDFEPKIIGVIPARFSSTRFPGKVLADLWGKPMLWWTYNQAIKALPNIIITTDDERVKNVAEDFGADVVMTSPSHPSGTDRVAEAVSNIDVDMVINIQADEPLIPPEMIRQVTELLNEQGVFMATLRKKIEKKEAEDHNIVKVVCDIEDYALYFSRSAIPYNGDFYKHIGIYGYKKDFLMDFVKLSPTPLEKQERLEQLRALEHGYRTKVGLTRHNSISVDTQEDLDVILKSNYQEYLV
ncbi:MAG: 3-deoxy-manno-octulosonate cytidylyltransferase [bacterium]|nr:3-deoxy-manno-octulosonate cytidylyltransferase [bacterium]